MFSEESLKRLNEIRNRILYIFELCKEEGIVKTLSDVKEKQPAIIMHLIVCNENLQKLQDNVDINLAEIFTKEDIRGLKAIRNIASHDYDGLNLGIIEEIIRNKLPKIEKNIDNFINKNIQEELNETKEQHNKNLENLYNQNSNKKLNKRK